MNNVDDYLESARGGVNPFPPDEDLADWYTRRVSDLADLYTRRVSSMKGTNNVMDATFNGMGGSEFYRAQVFPELFPHQKQMLIDNWSDDDIEMYVTGLPTFREPWEEVLYGR